MGGLFITFEGLEGGGKTTTLKLIAQKLKVNGFPVVETREPGGTQFAELVREQLFLEAKELSLTSHIGPETLSDKYIAAWLGAQAATVEEVIKPALEAGKIVLCDRYADTALAFLAYGAKRSPEQIAVLNRITTQNIIPDLTFFFDLPLELGWARKGYTYNDQTIVFYKDVEKGYQFMYQNDSESRWRRVDAARSFEENEAEIWEIVMEGIRLKGIEKENCYSKEIKG